MTEEIRKRAKAQRDERLDSPDKPPVTEVDMGAVPAEMKNRKRWINWRWRRNNDRWTKAPYRPNGLPAKTNEPSHLSSFGECCEALRSVEGLSGIGFVLGDDYVGIDLDNCRDQDTGMVAEDALRIADEVGSYTEISPTGTGLKIVCLGRKPIDWKDTDKVEVKERGYFTVTGQTLDGYPGECRRLDPLADLSGRELAPESDEYRHAINSLRLIPVPENEKDGSSRLIRYARQVARCGLDEIDGLRAIRQILVDRPMHADWSDDAILQRISQASERLAKEDPIPKARKLTWADMIEMYPDRQPELIDGLLREAEVMNVIGASKQGKSWLSYGLAAAVGLGMEWMGKQCQQKKVLLLDNELQPNELSFRLRKVAESLMLDPRDLASGVIIEPLRGRKPDLMTVEKLLERDYGGERIGLIIMDAFYRLLPSGVSENDNAAVTQLYGIFDSIAMRHNAAIALIHHSSKGDQSGKLVTDVGSGAGSMARAVDTHLVIRPHEQDGHAVIEAVCRSHAPPDPYTVRFDFPRWHHAPDVLPVVRKPLTGNEVKQKRQDEEADALVLDHLLGTDESPARAIREATQMSAQRVNRSLSRLESREVVFVVRTAQVKGKEVTYWGAYRDPDPS